MMYEETITVMRYALDDQWLITILQRGNLFGYEIGRKGRICHAYYDFSTDREETFKRACEEAANMDPELADADEREHIAEVRAKVTRHLKAAYDELAECGANYRKNPERVEQAREELAVLQERIAELFQELDALN